MPINIKSSMNALQHWMELNLHLANKEDVYELTLRSVSFGLN